MLYGDEDRREKDFKDFYWCLEELMKRKLPFIDVFGILNISIVVNEIDRLIFG